MKRLACIALLLGCTATTGPTATAEVVGGFWYVALHGDGVTSCVGLPYDAPGRDTAAEAIRDCRGVQ